MSQAGTERVRIESGSGLPDAAESFGQGEVLVASDRSGCACLRGISRVPTCYFFTPHSLHEMLSH